MAAKTAFLLASYQLWVSENRVVGAPGLGMLYESTIHPLTIISTLPSAGLSPAGVLPHHSSIFVFEYVAVVHEWTLACCWLRELHKQLGLALHKHNVLPARDVFGRCFVVQGKNSEKGSMDVEGMRHSDRHDFPNLGRSELGLDIGPVRIVRPPVDPDDGGHIRLTGHPHSLPADAVVEDELSPLHGAPDVHGLWVEKSAR
jgi:hypothetical protein